MTKTETVIALDRQRMEAMVGLDLPVLDRLLAGELIYTHSSAKVDSKASLIEAMTSGTNAYTSLEPSDVTGRDLGDYVMLTGAAAMTVSLSGRATSFRVRFLDLWALRDGAWQMIAWQSTRLRG
jgi:hypothetical protein